MSGDAHGAAKPAPCESLEEVTRTGGMGRSGKSDSGAQTTPTDCQRSTTSQFQDPSQDPSQDQSQASGRRQLAPSAWPATQSVRSRRDMPTIIDQAICVRHWDFSETSQTVSLFTRDHGMLRGLAKGSKRERGRFSGGIDLLTRGQVVALVKPGRELSTLTDWDLLQSFRALRERLDANCAAFYMAELVCRMILDSDPHPRVFDAFVAALGTLSTPADIVDSLVQFQWILLDESGHRPRLRADGPRLEASPAPGPTAAVEVVAFDPRGGGVVADGSRGTWPVRRATLDYLERVAMFIEGVDPDEMDAAAGGASDETFDAVEPEGEWSTTEDRATEDRATGDRATGDRATGDRATGDRAAEDSPAGDGPNRREHAEPPEDAPRRAARLLAGCIREVLGVEPITLPAVFGSIPPVRRAP